MDKVISTPIDDEQAASQEASQNLEAMIKENLSQMNGVNEEDKQELIDGITVHEQLQQQIDSLYNKELESQVRKITTKVKLLKKPHQEEHGPKELKGYLLKKSPALFRGWQNRYVILKERKFYYYSSEIDTEPKGIINFDLAKSIVTQIDKFYFKIQVNGSDRDFSFKSHDEAITSEWVTQIRQHIDAANSQGKYDPKTYFWKFDAISEQQFVDLADTGDILLFRGKNFGCKITRTFTNSHFDHVAMVLKFETDPNEVYFVDATSTRGVSLCKWSIIRKFVGDFYEQIILRHLESERSNDMIDKLEVFLKEAVGLKYGLSTQKLLFQRNTVKPTKGKFIDEERTFFCSELVAKAYKVLGIMEDDDRACSIFYPSSFSSKSNLLKLNPGINLGPELNIVVENPQAKQESKLSKQIQNQPQEKRKSTVQ